MSVRRQSLRPADRTEGAHRSREPHPVLPPCAEGRQRRPQQPAEWPDHCRRESSLRAGQLQRDRRKLHDRRQRAGVRHGRRGDAALERLERHPFVHVADDSTNRVATTTSYRMAVVTGKGIPFPQPAGTDASFGSDGGAHNFVRSLEDWDNGGAVSTAIADRWSASSSIGKPSVRSSVAIRMPTTVAPAIGRSTPTSCRPRAAAGHADVPRRQHADVPAVAAADAIADGSWFVVRGASFGFKVHSSRFKVQGSAVRIGWCRELLNREL